VTSGIISEDTALHKDSEAEESKSGHLVLTLLCWQHLISMSIEQARCNIYRLYFAAQCSNHTNIHTNDIVKKLKEKIRN